MFVGWSDSDIRERCQAGTQQELAAYLAAGYLLVPTANNPEYTLHTLADAIASKHGVTAAQLRGSQNTQTATAARKEFAAYAYCNMGRSTPQIAKFLGDRDHSGIIYLLQQAGVNRRSHGHTFARTHCKRGHEYTPDNIYYYPNTHKRMCKACRRVLHQQQAQKRRASS